MSHQHTRRDSVDGSASAKLMSLRKLEGTDSPSFKREQHPAAAPLSLSLDDLSNPPTEEELSHYCDVPAAELPPIHKRALPNRIFVNRDLRLDKIEFYGFDMDYTLAEYKSPEFEQLAYGMLIDRLIEMGYPQTISTLRYEPGFPLRGLLLDKEHGNFLKVDSFGNIVSAVHGRTRMTKKHISEIYPSMYIHSQDIGRRYYVLTTLFTLPEACLYGSLVEHLERKTSLRLSTEVAEEKQMHDEPPVHTEQHDNTPQTIDSDLSYTNLYQDIRAALDFLHDQGSLKTRILANTEKYINKHKELPTLLTRMRRTGAKVFLLTNSEYYYTNHVMTYLLSSPEKVWRDYFDVIIVGADKPRFFGEGSTIREVNLETGTLLISKMHDHFEPGKVYHGGSLSLFQKLTGAKGNKVLYIGDHIFADIIKSKKSHGWRNLLVVPELHHELQVWQLNQDKYNHLLNLEFMKAEIFRGLDSESTQPPDVQVLRSHIKATIEEVNKRYNEYFGSLFRSGSKHSFFAMQVQRYADLYTSSYLNLLNYPLFYQFSATSPALAHETPYSTAPFPSAVMESDKQP